MRLVNIDYLVIELRLIVVSRRHVPALGEAHLRFIDVLPLRLVEQVVFVLRSAHLFVYRIVDNLADEVTVLQEVWPLLI